MLQAAEQPSGAPHLRLNTAHQFRQALVLGHVVVELHLQLMQVGQQQVALLLVAAQLALQIHQA